MEDVSVQWMLTWTPEEIKRRVKEIKRPDGTYSTTPEEIRDCLEQMVIDGVWSVPLKTIGLADDRTHHRVHQPEGSTSTAARCKI